MDMGFKNLQLKFDQNLFMKWTTMTVSWAHAKGHAHICLASYWDEFQRPTVWAKSTHALGWNYGRKEGKATYSQYPCTSYTGPAKICKTWGWTETQIMNSILVHFFTAILIIIISHLSSENRQHSSWSGTLFNSTVLQRVCVFRTSRIK